MFKLLKQFEGHTAEVRCCALLDSGKLVTGGFDATCIVWDLGCEPVSCFGHSDFVYAISSHPAGVDMFISTGKDRNIFVFSVDGRKISNFEMSTEIHKGPICSLTHDGGSRLFAGSWDGSISVWNIASNDLLHHLPQAGAYATVVKYCKSTLVSGSQDKALTWWDEDLKKINQIQNAHSDIIRAIAYDNDVIATASNDCTVKLWTIDGHAREELHGHTNFVFSVDVLNKTVISSGEDRSLKIWDSSTQTIPHPGTVWFAKWINSESIVTGCSDGIVRIFSSVSSASQEECDAFELLSLASQPNAPAVDPTTVPPESDLSSYAGKKIGEIKMFKDLENNVYAYSWTETNVWEKIGLVTSSVMSGGKIDYFGDQYFESGRYDFVFDVELGETRMAKLPYNKGDNPLSVAEKFCSRESINKSNVTDIVAFIKKNAPQPSIPNPESTAVLQDPFLFRDAKWGPMTEKLQSFISDPVDKMLLSSVLEILEKRKSAEFRPSEVSLIHSKLLTSVPIDQLFVLFDLWRLFVLHPGAAVMYKNSDRGAQYIATAAKYLQANPTNNTGLCAARYLANLFALSVSKWAAVELYHLYLPTVVEVINMDNVNKQTKIACASVVANLGITTKEKKNASLADELSQRIKLITQSPEVMERIESVFRAT